MRKGKRENPDFTIENTYKAEANNQEPQGKDATNHDEFTLNWDYNSRLLYRQSSEYNQRQRLVSSCFSSLTQPYPVDRRGNQVSRMAPLLSSVSMGNKSQVCASPPPLFGVS